MAGTLNSIRGNIIKESKILVKVDHASEDLLVVSYPFKNKLFQGILIDSTNRYLPCAYPKPEVVKWSPPRIDPKDPLSSVEGLQQTPDINRPFYSLSNRFTYFQDVLFQKNIALVKTAKQAKAKAQKMTVRLRPRQVLCSKCRSICNENSENVHSSSSRKDSKNDNNSKKLLTESSDNENQNLEVKSPRKKVTTLIPRLSRLEPEEMRSVNGNQSEASRVWSEMLEADKQMVLRKKRSVGSMEDLWDETVFEEAAKKAKTTPIIKISFGSPGEGTVVKIPAKVTGLTASEGEDEAEKDSVENSKAFKKALKKAKKEAKRKISPEREETPLPEEPNYKKHRHRVKHKKKHKNSKEEESIKDKCLKQKLSINLKRVCGPGEEESWSGESSRSSEMIKDYDEAKADLTSLHNIPSRCSGDDSQDCKTILRFQSQIDFIESDKRSTKIKAQKKRKLENLVSERLASGALKHDVISVISTNVLSEFTDPNVNTPSIPIKEEIDNIPPSVEADNRFPKKVKIKDNPDISDITDDSGQLQPDKLAEQNLVLTLPSDVSSFEYQIPSLVGKNSVVRKTGDSRLSGFDDALDESKFGDTLLDSKDQVVEPVLESNKKIPDDFESRTPSSQVCSLEDDKINALKLSDKVTSKTESALVIHSLQIKTSDQLSSNSILGDSKINPVNSGPSFLSLEDSSVVKPQEQFSKFNLERRPNVLVEEVVDSSEESEFLPAEDNLDNPVEYPSHKIVSSPPDFVESSSIEALSNKDQREVDCTSPTLSNLGCPILEAAQTCSSPTEFTDAMLESRSDLSPPPLEKYQDEPLVSQRRDISDSSSIPLDQPISPPQLGCASDSNLKYPVYVDSDPLGLKEELPSSDLLPCLSDSDPSSLSDNEISEYSDKIVPLQLDRQEKMDICLESPTNLVSSDVSDSVPDFPPSSPRGTHQDVTSCRTIDGSILNVGDIVWAKIQDFPWWPAKVVRLCASISNDGSYDARVAWFGSATSTLMSADQLSPFIQTFQAKYNRDRKSSGYLAAIRQATNEASSRDYHQPLAEIHKLLAS